MKSLSYLLPNSGDELPLDDETDVLVLVDVRHRDLAAVRLQIAGHCHAVVLLVDWKNKFNEDVMDSAKL